MASELVETAKKGDPAASVYHDASGEREKSGYNQDKSTKEVEHSMLAESRELIVKLQKELEKFQKESSIAAKQQQHEKEIQKIKAEQALELSTQKETLQKTIKMEIDREKRQLMQEFSSRISQEVTKACKKQELRIKQLNRTNRNLREDKQGQEMDMEAYRKTIASQEEDLVRANRRVPELMQQLDERSQEIGRLHAKIGSLEKTADEALSQVERTAMELERTKKELEATKREVEYALDSASDNEAAPGFTGIRPWGSSNRTPKGGSQGHNFNIETKKLAAEKPSVETQSGQINILREEVLRLEKAREEDDTIIKQQRRKIHSLEGLPQRFFALTESFENLKAEMDQLRRVEEQDKAIIKQQQNEISAESQSYQIDLLREEILRLKKAREEEDDTVIKQQRINIHSALTETIENLKAENYQLCKVEERDKGIIKRQRNEIDELLITRAKLKAAQESLDAKETDLMRTMIKLEKDKATIKQQQCEIYELVITRAKLKEKRRLLNAKQADLEKTTIKLKQVSSELHNIRRIQTKSNAKHEEPHVYNQGRPALPARPIYPKPKAGASTLYLDKQNQWIAAGKTPQMLAAPKNNIIHASSFQEIDLGRRNDIVKESNDDDDYDDNVNLQEILEKAVAKGAAVIAKVERLVIASGWLGGSGK